MMRRALALGTVLVLALPQNLAATVLVHPAWRRFEEVTGIESFGHSGPAGWCYLLGYTVLVAAAVFIVARRGIWDKKGETAR